MKRLARLAPLAPLCRGHEAAAVPERVRALPPGPTIAAAAAAPLP